MLKLIAKKVAQVLIVMLLISFFSFIIIDLAPGDISSMYITEDMTEAEKALVMERLGLDKSVPEQYFSWLTEALKGNFGYSMSNKLPVVDLLMSRLPDTILLMGVSLLVSLTLSIPLGLIAGYKKNTFVDNLISGFAYFGMSMIFPWSSISPTGSVSCTWAIWWSFPSPVSSTEIRCIPIPRRCCLPCPSPTPR